MLRPNTERVKKKLGYHILAFCIGALLPLPFLSSADGTPDHEEQQEVKPDSQRQPEWEAGAVRYVGIRAGSSSNIRDDDRQYRHNA
jgi:hypothetical protein